MIGGDFNARTGEERGGIVLEEKTDKEKEDEWKRNKNSKDRKMNTKEKLLVEFLEEKGRGIFNECTVEDEKGMKRGDLRSQEVRETW